ncbi:large-conductance mechanosensitive channel protein MscL [Candidatus Kaiserbacteria bacterium]|nr:large-conductance mechanosensitive channel protein MscL [Candidatus Kaiserbacteria bacterium]
MKQGFLAEFKTFVLRGNVVDLAVAVVMGTAFNKIVSSLVETVIMPAVSMLFGIVDLSSWAFEADGISIRYGIFLQSIVDFILIALAIFVAIKVMNRLKHRQENEPETLPPPPEDIQLLREIRDILNKRPDSDFS